MSNSTTDNHQHKNPHIGQRIKKARQAAGLSQKELGQALKLSDKTVSAYEVGRAQPSLEKLKQLSRATHKSISYFLDDKDPDDLGLQLRVKQIEQELIEIKQAIKALANKD
jgi:transcriptional regulator with XRE-family HTH domain